MDFLGYFAFIIAIAITALGGVGIEFTAYRPLKDAPKISVLISAIGVSFLLENLAVVLFGGRPKAFPDVKIIYRCSSYRWGFYSKTYIYNSDCYYSIVICFNYIS